MDGGRHGTGAALKLFPAVRTAILILAAAALASPAQAQFFAHPHRPEPPPSAEEQIWPFPTPDPQTWWDEDRPRAPEAADPLGGRRLPRGIRRTSHQGAPIRVAAHRKSAPVSPTHRRYPAQ